MTIKGFFNRMKASAVNTERKPRTFEQMYLDKLKEIGRATAGEWASAMGYTYPSSLAKVIKRIKKKTPEKLKVYNDMTPTRYEAT